jgi:hypothetical protein
LAISPRGGGGLAPGQLTPRSTPRLQPPADPLPGSHLLKDLYLNDIRAFLAPPLQETVNELEAICEERRQLAQQKRLHHVLHGWPLVHVPLSTALLLLSITHAVVALRY